MPGSTDKKSGKFDPKRYLALIGKVELSQINLQSCSVDFKEERLTKVSDTELQIKMEAKFQQKEENVKVAHTYTLLAKNPGVKDYVLKISACFCVVYLSPDYTFEDSFFETFKKIHLPAHSWPYFRELVQSMTQRINLPPLTLPIYKGR